MSLPNYSSESHSPQPTPVGREKLITRLKRHIRTAMNDLDTLEEDLLAAADVSIDFTRFDGRLACATESLQMARDRIRDRQLEERTATGEVKP
jgi:hypothetical protein